MTTLNLFSDADVATIKEMVRWFSTHRNTPFSEEADETGHQAPEVYLAKVPGGGIPALAGTGIAGDIPGKALCTIYYINQYGELVLIPNFSKIVYNLSTSAITSNWVPIVRDKLGSWVPAGVAGAGGFLGTATSHIYQGLDPANAGTVIDTLGSTYTVFSPLGAVVHGAYVWVELDSQLGKYIAVNTSCPSGTAT